MPQSKNASSKPACTVTVQLFEGLFLIYFVFIFLFSLSELTWLASLRSFLILGDRSNLSTLSAIPSLCYPLIFRSISAMRKINLSSKGQSSASYTYLFHYTCSKNQALHRWCWRMLATMLATYDLWQIVTDIYKTITHCHQNDPYIRECHQQNDPATKLLCKNMSSL